MTKRLHLKALVPYLPVLFFPLTILYEELLLRFGAVEGIAFDYHLLYTLVFGVAFGALFYAVVGCFRSRKVRLALTALITFLLVVVFCAEYCVKSFFQIFYEISYMITMSTSVTEDFGNETRQTIISSIPFILASLYPLLMLYLYHKHIVPEAAPSKRRKAGALAVFAGLEVLTCGTILLGGDSLQDDRGYFTSEYSINSSIPLFGMMSSMQLEFTYKLIGVPETTPFGDENVVVEVTPEPDPVYDYNMVDIPFARLAESADNDVLQSMHAYFGSKVPTQQNEYTGMFKDKNLIFIVAEAFSPYVIDKERTPTLYKLSTQGFVFNNFYQPDWHQSTTGGEFSAMTGLIPTKVDGALSFLASASKDMPYALGHQFNKLGYVSRAYHNNSYTFYERHRTHPNLGYDYKGIYNGLELITGGAWPRSDHEMIQVTADEYIDNYVNNGEKFHTYYMTISGHALYNWDSNRMSRKHKDEVKDLDYPQNVLGYLACQMEVEYALQELMQKLVDAGIADDTVICLTSDHYPYKLGDKDYNKLETEPSNPLTMDRYRNTLILWCGSMDEPVVIDDPCSSIDIVPTLSNLFGLEYDSRLYSGRDILSTNYDVADPNSPQPFAISADSGAGSSWVSLAGSYDATNGTFTPAPGYEDYAENTDYIKAMSKKAKDMFKFSRFLISKDYYKVLGEYINPPEPTPVPTPDAAASPTPGYSDSAAASVPSATPTPAT